MPLPRYFEDLYEEFTELQDFDLKDVIYSKKRHEEFMKAVRESIEAKQEITPLKKREVWRVVQETKYPIILGALITVQGFWKACILDYKNMAFSFAKSGMYVLRIQDNFAISTRNVKA